MNVCIQFTKKSLTEKTSVAYGIGEERREVLIDKVIVDYMNEYCHSDWEAKQLIELIMLENIHFIEYERDNSHKKYAVEDYLVNAIGASLLNITPIAHSSSQTTDMKFDNLVFQCGKVVSKSIRVPQFIVSMMKEEDIVQIVEKEAANIDAADFNFRLFADFVRGILFARLLEHKIEASNWVH